MKPAQMHPLKLVSLLSWLSLFGFQLALLWPGFGIDYYWVLLLSLPLLLPAHGLIKEKIYTYRWVGFMMLIYFCIGISELVSNPALRVYAVGTTLSSLCLFLASIYFARYLGLRRRV